MPVWIIKIFFSLILVSGTGLSVVYIAEKTDILNNIGLDGFQKSVRENVNIFDDTDTDEAILVDDKKVHTGQKQFYEEYQNQKIQELNQKIAIAQKKFLSEYKKYEELKKEAFELYTKAFECNSKNFLNLDKIFKDKFGQKDFSKKVKNLAKTKNIEKLNKQVEKTSELKKIEEKDNCNKEKKISENKKIDDKKLIDTDVKKDNQDNNDLENKNKNDIIEVEKEDNKIGF